MKRTKWAMAVSMNSTYVVYRAVWEKDGRYYVKDEDKIWDVTDKKNTFTEKWVVGIGKR